MADGYVNRLNADPATLLPEYPAAAERQFSVAHLMGGATGLAVRAGRVLGAGLEVTVGGTSVTVQPGVCVVPAANSTSGPFVVAIPAAVTLTLPARPAAGLQRRDLVVARVYDEDAAEVPTTLREVRIEIVQGTAAASPSTPAAPAMGLALATLTNTDTTTSLLSTSSTYTWARGGVGVVGSQSERDALTPYSGLVVYRSDLSTFEARVGSSWKTLSDPTETGWVSLGTSLQANWANDAARDPSVRRSGNRVTLTGGINRVNASLTNTGIVAQLWTLASQYRPARNVEFLAPVYDTGTGGGPVVGGMVRFLIDTAGAVSVANVGSSAITTTMAVRFHTNWVLG